MVKKTIKRFLKRVFGLEKPKDCSRHVFRAKVGEKELMIDPVTGRWFRKCATCKCRRVYSRMVRCFECQWYLHKGCADRSARRGEDRLLSTDRDRAVVRSVDASTHTEPTAAVCSAIVATRGSAAEVDVDDSAVLTDEAVVDMAASQCSAIATYAAATVDDEHSAVATVTDDETIPVVSDDDSRTQGSVTADYDDVIRPEVDAVAPSEVEIVRSDVHLDNDSEKTVEQRTTRFAQFSKIDQIVVADNGDHDQAIIPIGHDLRCLKGPANKLTALRIMKAENCYKNVINDIGLDPFYLHYHTEDQTRLYINFACKNIELILENHISSLRGLPLLKSNNVIIEEDTSTNNKNKNSKKQENNMQIIHLQVDDSISPIFNDKSCFESGDIQKHPSSYTNIDRSTIQSIESKCAGVTIPEKIETNVSCSRDVEFMVEETASTENWNKSTDKMRIRSNPNLNTHQRQLQNINKNKTLPILKNGSPRTHSGELKSYTIRNFGQVILCNTCAFDSVASILMVAYCDSINYKTVVDGKENVFLKFIAGIVKKGISAKAYSTRAEILMKYLQPNIEYIDYDTKLASCETTVGNVIKELLTQLPTIIDNIKCSIPTCTITVPLPLPYITIIVINGNLNSLEEDIKARLMTETSKCQKKNRKGINCKGIKTIEPNISTVHLFIELLNWEENAADQNVGEVAQQVLISLENIPQTVKVNNVQYHLRGICSHAHELSGQRNDVGHYRAYCKRYSGNNWELFDDQKTKSVPVNCKTKVPCELLIYSI